MRPIFVIKQFTAQCTPISNEQNFMKLNELYPKFNILWHYIKKQMICCQPMKIQGAKKFPIKIPDLYRISKNSPVFMNEILKNNMCERCAIKCAKFKM